MITLCFTNTKRRSNHSNCYVDDIILTGGDVEEMTRVRNGHLA